LKALEVLPLLTAEVKERIEAAVLGTTDLR
jgi:hypothetical protein